MNLRNKSEIYKMEIITPGHLYKLQEYDYYQSEHIQTLRFMKRIGDKFPGNNPPAYSGTNCQEVIRALINRLQYLQNQKPCIETETIIFHQRQSLIQFENRAMRIKDININSTSWPWEIEKLIPCKICGHIYPHNCKEKS